MTCLALALAVGAIARSAASETPSASAPASVPAGPRRLSFDVFLDDRPIGFQRFDLSPVEDGLEVETRARFSLDLLRIRALDYDHQNRERWRGGCLQSIESRTRQNGKAYRVVGRADARGLEVEGEKGRARLAGCVGTFSYWDREAMRARKQLLNSQTGEYVAVELRPLGTGTLRIAEREIEVERLAIEGEDLEIELAYARASGEWVGLDSPLFMGRTLRYRRSVAELEVDDSTRQPRRSFGPSKK